MNSILIKLFLKGDQNNASLSSVTGICMVWGACHQGGVGRITCGCLCPYQLAFLPTGYFPCPFWSVVGRGDTRWPALSPALLDTSDKQHPCLSLGTISPLSPHLFKVRRTCLFGLHSCPVSIQSVADTAGQFRGCSEVTSDFTKLTLLASFSCWVSVHTSVAVAHGFAHFSLAEDSPLKSHCVDLQFWTLRRLEI